MELKLEDKIKELYNKICIGCFCYIQDKIRPIQKSELCNEIHSHLDNYDMDSGIVIRSSFSYSPRFDITKNNTELFELQKIILSFRFNKIFDDFEMDDINCRIFEERLLYIINRVTIYDFYIIWEELIIIISEYYNNFRYMLIQLNNREFDKFKDKDNFLYQLQIFYDELNNTILEYINNIKDCKLIEYRIMRCNINFIQSNISSKEISEFFVKLNDNLDFFENETSLDWQNKIIDNKIKNNNKNKYLIPLLKVLNELKDFKLESNIYLPENYKKYCLLIRKIFETRYYYVSEIIDKIEEFQLKCIINSDINKFINVINKLYNIKYENYDKSNDYRILQKNILKNRYLQTLMVKIMIILNTMYSEEESLELENIIYNIIKTSNLDFLFDTYIIITTTYFLDINDKIYNKCQESKYNQRLNKDNIEKIINIISNNIKEILH